MTKKPFFIILAIYVFHLHLLQGTTSLEKSYIYPKNSQIDQASWNQLAPFFLPEAHPSKPALDVIFSSARITDNLETFITAGFKVIGRLAWNKAIVAKHPFLPGLIVKIYLDDQYGFDEKHFFSKRLFGAHLIRQAVILNGYSNYFKVPTKWIYPLPEHPPGNPEKQLKHFILVEEDMDIVSADENLKMFKKKINKNILNALYHLISTLGLSDSVYVHNIPFSKDGKMAFIDTERYQLFDIRYYKLNRFLDSKMENHWKKLSAQPAK